MGGGSILDRPEKEKTITIKINGQHRSFVENRLPKNEGKNEGENEDTAVKKQKTFKKIPEQTGKLESAAAKELEEDDFDWILPEEMETPSIKEYNILPKPKKQKKKRSFSFGKQPKNSFLTSVFLTVFFAVVLGTSFGFIMLKLVITENTIEKDQPVMAEKQAEEKIQTPTEEVKLASIPASIVQGGVFSSAESAKTIQEELVQKGVPAQIIELDGKAYIYLGVADSIEHAKAIGSQLKSKGVEVFAKEITLPEKTLDGISSEEKRLLNSLSSVYSALAAGAADGMLSQAISEQSAENIKKQEAVFKTIDSSQLKNEKIVQIEKDLKESFAQVNAYQASKDQAALTKLQQSLLDFMGIYQTL